MTSRNRGRDEANLKEKGGPKIGLALLANIELLQGQNKPPSFILAKHSSGVVMVPPLLRDQISEVLKRNGAKFDGFVKSQKSRHSCESREPEIYESGFLFSQETLDSRFRGNDENEGKRTFYEIIKFDVFVKSRHSGENRSPENL